MISEKEIKKVVQRIAKIYGPEKIILFGSFAWGEPGLDSDVDLLIVKETKQNFFKRNMAVRNIVNGALPVDILVRTPQEIKNRLFLGDFFYKNIIKKGKKLYVKSKKRSE